MDNRHATPYYRKSSEKQIYLNGLMTGAVAGAMVAVILTLAFIDLTGGI